MPISAQQQSYEKRLARVTRYLHTHLHEELDLNKLAEIACMSPYHWHRIYQGMHGESIISTVKRLRLQQAALQLSRTTQPVSAIAIACGYPNLQSFTRIFSAAYGMPPARYRQQGSWRYLPDPPATRRDLNNPRDTAPAELLTDIYMPLR